MATVYYYYAYLENNICIDVERSRNPKSNMTDYVEITADQYAASYDGDTTSIDYIIGMMWDGYSWVEAPHIFYAVLNESQICRNVIESMLQITDSDYIAISAEEYSSRATIGKKYNRVTGSWQAVVFPEGADTDTKYITVNGTTKNLQDFLVQLQASIDESAGTQLSAIDILAMITNVDGTDSGLDSDLLDGHDSAYFARNQDVQAMMVEMDSLAASSGQSVIKSIQRGVNNYSVKTVTLPQAVNPDKCIVILQGISVIAVGNYEYVSQFYTKSLTSTTLTVEHMVNGESEMGSYSWQVIEFN